MYYKFHHFERKSAKANVYMCSRVIRETAVNEFKEEFTKNKICSHFSFNPTTDLGISYNKFVIIDKFLPQTISRKTRDSQWV